MFEILKQVFCGIVLGWVGLLFVLLMTVATKAVISSVIDEIKEWRAG